MLADPFLARVHQLGDLPGVGAPLGIGDVGELRRPRGRLERDESAGAAADAGVDDGGMSRTPVRSRCPTASASTWRASRPASSAARSVRHSHCA